MYKSLQCVPFWWSLSAKESAVSFELLVVRIEDVYKSRKLTTTGQELSENDFGELLIIGLL